MTKINKLSASKIEIYKGCSLAYYLQYIKHEKVPRNVRLVFGKAIHYMLDRFYQVNYKSSDSFVKYWRYYWFSDIAGDFLKGKEKDGLETKEFEVNRKFNIKIGNHLDLGPEPVGVFFGYMKLGEGILREFYSRHKSREPPFEKEKSFGIKKDEPIDIAGHLVRGVFDRIDNLDGRWFITDYKTDKSSPEKDSFVLHRSPQFTLYSYAFRELFETTEEALLYYHLRTGDIFKTYRSQKDYDYLKSLLDEVANGIETEKFVPFYGSHCKFCDYKVACEKYSIPHHGGPRIDKRGKIIGAKKFTEWDAETPEWIEMQSEDR